MNVDAALESARQSKAHHPGKQEQIDSIANRRRGQLFQPNPEHDDDGDPDGDVKIE